jgi:hypothetical protein
MPAVTSGAVALKPVNRESVLTGPQLATIKRLLDQPRHRGRNAASVDAGIQRLTEGLK